MLTIARGTVPLAVFGPYAYGERPGLLGAPARAAQAFAPLLFGLLLDRMGIWVIAFRRRSVWRRFVALFGLRASERSVETDPEKQNAPDHEPGRFVSDVVPMG